VADVDVHAVVVVGVGVDSDAAAAEALVIYGDVGCIFIDVMKVNVGGSSSDFSPISSSSSSTLSLWSLSSNSSLVGTFRFLKRRSVPSIAGLLIQNKGSMNAEVEFSKLQL
jgi:hypothetical protein